ncbi:MAG TPA: LURP-one-related family protein [Candidatus Nanoarchaeia archaeon]|nr:LURP-one-related family protein [Candidatus Nanoarchaeia archaeon]
MSIDASLLEAKDFVMKKKILSLREHYDFEDLSGVKLGEADGSFIQIPAKFAVVDIHGLELLHLQGKVFTLRNEFNMYGPTGEELGTMKKKILKLVGEEFWLEKGGVEFMRIYGNFTEHDYQMEINGAPVASVHKKWVSLRDQFGVSITGEVDPRVVIGAVIIIEHVEVTEKASGASSSGGSFR